MIDSGAKSGFTSRADLEEFKTVGDVSSTLANDSTINPPEQNSHKAMFMSCYSPQMLKISETLIVHDPLMRFLLVPTFSRVVIDIVFVPEYSIWCDSGDDFNILGYTK